MSNNIIEVVRDSLDGRQNVSPTILEKVPVYVKRAIIKLQKEGALPPKIYEFTAEDKKEERRDNNGNLLYNFFFLPSDFMRLDRLSIHYNDENDNETENPYQHVSNDTFFNKRRDSDDRKFFSIVDYNIDDEKPRKILVADPFPEDDEHIEVRYFVNGTEDTLDNFGEEHWEAIIATVENILGLRSPQDTEDVVLEESSGWRNQEGQNSYNKTFKKTKVRFPFGK